jgi:hypothetical protein
MKNLKIRYILFILLGTKFFIKVGLGGFVFRCAYLRRRSDTAIVTDGPQFYETDKMAVRSYRILLYITQLPCGMTGSRTRTHCVDVCSLRM